MQRQEEEKLVPLSLEKYKDKKEGFTIQMDNV